MTQKYIHFTDLEGARAINKSGEIWQSSYGPSGAVFAVAVGASFVPSVQLQFAGLGRAKNRSVAVMFETTYLPDYAMPEEVMWHLPSLPIKIIKIMFTHEATKMLNKTLSEDPETEMLQISLHPAFNDLGIWTRMPDDFSSWIPGLDNAKYFQARQIFLDTEDVNKVRSFWKKPDNIRSNDIKEYVKNIVKEFFC